MAPESRTPNPASPSASSRRVAVITGAGQGIGLFTALGLARAGFHVALVARSAERGRETVEELVHLLARPEEGPRGEGRDAAAVPVDPAAAFSWVAADLALGDQIREAAGILLDRHPHLHLLVNNAGVASRAYRATPEGLEATLSVNHLAPVRLTHHLLPGLLAAGAADPAVPARIVLLSSGAHARRLDLTAFEGPRGYSGLHAYAQSKLLNLLHTFDLARHLQGSGVTVNAVHPGLAATGLLMDFLPAGIVRRAIAPVLRILARSPEHGARTSLHVATSPEVAGITGSYFARGAPAEPAAAALERENQEGVRRWTEELIGVDWRSAPAPHPNPREG
jgi:NAD(P)-dependent dehydrogenase (short-subunit alcohol dehydrogenase family)